MVNVFVSRPTDLTPRQLRFHDALLRFLAHSHLRPRTVGASDFTNRSPLQLVSQLMDECCGALILGFAQLSFSSGVSKPGTRRERRVRGLLLPTPWNHLEAGIAFHANLPLFVIREAGVAPEGIFDPSVSDYFVHHTELKPRWLRSNAFIQPFEEWQSEVMARANGRCRVASKS